MSHSTSNAHLLVYPYHTSGHIIPLLDLTNLLLHRGLTITVAINTASLPLLDPLVSSYPSSLHKLVLHDPEISPFSHPAAAKLVSTRKLFDPIAKWFETHPLPPVAILADIVLGWTSELASKLGIRHVVFSASGALAFSIYHAMWQDVEKFIGENHNGDENFVISFPEMPNSPQFTWWQIARVARYYKKEDPDYESLRKGMMANLKSWAIICNTFEELEGVYINHMKKHWSHDQVWAVGPLLPDEHGPMGSSGRGGSSAVPPHDLLMWLDKKRDDSVVYICFGSKFTLSEKQVSELANALELSYVDFILCLKKSDSSFIPSGFEDRVGDRGFIVKGWSPQLAILRHRAVGSFVSHCGWNSTLEGVAAGVLMLTWPMGVDQFANACILVDQLCVGKRVCEGGPEVIPDSVELARLLDESSSSDLLERVKVKELSRAATKTVKDTSLRDLDMFVKCLSEL
ncbi:UDP-Glycosyltransferase superfamily protein [Artemisia annua]|uniref:UDP-Glycosyltransferase superfamily protein n=1 Tax=Artemisia annua TaxID=35608 RepID=A0A2U1KYK8_ARTAN|nr:UDP-Glycosyltransferase superfamily protein [Artemisia annua]